ncbi:MAG TPA: translocation/assembly module TamB domain-containing protein, partial [Flavobacterium sp.]|nr:translocation/assembly module TamB domain-containing protein [Flavobacterium sp.]
MNFQWLKYKLVFPSVYIPHNFFLKYILIMYSTKEITIFVSCLSGKFKTNTVIKKLLKILFGLLLGLALVLILAAVIITTPIVQTELAHYATEKINEKFNIRTSIGQVAIQLNGRVFLKKVHILDDRNNDFAFIDQLHTNIVDFKQLIEGKLLFGSTELHTTNFFIRKYKGDTLTNLDKFIAVFDDGKPGDGSFLLKIDDLELTNGHFTITDDNTGTNPIDFKEMNGSLNNFIVRGSNINADVTNLNFKDKRGIDVKDLTASFAMTKTSMDLKPFAIETQESYVKGTIEMRYNEGDLKYFTERVQLNVDLQKSKVATNDLKSFYNEFGSNNMLYLNTKAKGTLNNFTLQNTQLSDKFGSEIIGGFALKNLFVKKDPFRIEANLDRLSITRENAVALLPNILGTALPNELQNLGLLFLTGTVAYEDYKVDVDVETTSALGFAQADVTLEKVNEKQQATYKGNVTLDNFDIGKLIGNEKVGATTLTAEVDGKSFDPESFHTILKSEVTSFGFNGYNYEHISIDGNLKLPAYTGSLVSQDPNALIHFDGTLDLSSDRVAVDFKADIERLNMNALHIVNDSLGVFKGHFELKGTGKNVDLFEGTVLAQNASYTNSNATYDFDHLFIESTFEENEIRNINITSNDIVNGYIRGNFKYNQLQALVENALGSLYKNYSPFDIGKNQFVTYDLKIQNKVVDLLVPKLEISDNTSISGKITADTGEFILNMNAPFVKYKQNKISNLHVDVNSLNEKQNAYISMDTIDLKIYKMYDFVLNNSKRNDTLYVDTKFKGGTEATDSYQFNLYHTINEENKSIIGIEKSQLQFKESLWYFNEFSNHKNRVIFNKKINDFTIEDLELSHNDQTVLLFGSMKGNAYKDFNLEFENVDLDKITPDLNSLTFGGLINGNISFTQEDQIFKPKSKLNIKDLAINDVLLGLFNFDVEGDESLQNFKVKSNIVNDFTESFYMNGMVNFEKGKSQLNLDAGLNKLNLKAIAPFLSSIMSDLRGDASGRVTISGTHKDPEIEGKLYLTNAGMRPVFTGVDYLFDENAPLDVTENQFILRNVNITDSKYKTTGILNGVISHNKLKNWNIDAKLTSSNLLALDLKYQEGTPYYGTAFIDGTATVKGPVEALVVDIEAKSKPGTKIKIPLDDAGGLGDNNYVHFLSPEEKANRLKGIETPINTNRFGGVQLNFEFYLTTDAEIEILLDRASGHGMKGKGAGFITMEINTLGRFNMWGDFMVYNGEYNFKYGGIIDKKLDVVKYGTIRWDGEPLNAVLDLRAVYKTQANPGVIIESSEINRKVDTEVSVVLQGNLSSPEIDFLIDFPNVSSSIKSEIEYKLADKDTRETQA